MKWKLLKPKLGQLQGGALVPLPGREWEDQVDSLKEFYQARDAPDQRKAKGIKALNEM